jgi:hypothetical protein
MNARDLPPGFAGEPAVGLAAEPGSPAAVHGSDEAHPLAPLLRSPAAFADHAAAASRHEAPSQAPAGVVIGELLALEEGAIALVRYAGQPGTCALRAASTVDLHGAHIGASVVLAFERADPLRPVVLGIVRGSAAWPLAEPPGQVQVDADGQRLVVNAREQLVLRCGKASITLTKAGKVLIEGSYLLSRSSGVNRIKGGSVQLN